MNWFLLANTVLIFINALLLFWCAREAYQSKLNRLTAESRLTDMHERIESTVGVWRSRLARHAGGPGADPLDAPSIAKPQSREALKLIIRKRAGMNS